MIQGISGSYTAQSVSALNTQQTSVQDTGGTEETRAGKRPPPPPPPPAGSGSTDSSDVDEGVVSLIADVLESYDESDDSVSFFDALTAAMEEEGYDTSAPIMDFYA